MYRNYLNGFAAIVSGPFRLAKARFGLAMLFAVLFTLCGAGASGQTVTGSIRGTILDPSGAAIPGVKVSAKEVNTGVVTTTVTDRSGTYNFQSLRIGTYVVSANKTGFGTISNRPFSLEIDQIAKIDMKLSVGDVAATVEVSADSGSLLQTEDASLGTTITANTLEGMPLPGQNFATSTVLVPGAVLPTYNALGSTQGTERDTSFASSTQPSFNGNRMQTNNYILDGTDINEPLQNTIGYNIASDAIDQMRIITGNADAEYGNVNGGEVLIVTRSGSNQFHGTAYEFYENQLWQANTFANKYLNPIVPRSNFHQSQFGGRIGGPIFRNKLFFFGDYEGFRNTTANASTVISVPSLRMRTGDFSELLGAPTLDYGQTIPVAQYKQLYNTTSGLATATPYVNNQLPVANPVAQYIFAHPEFYPKPNRPSSNANSPDTNNYGGYNKSAYVNNQYDVRVDYNPTSKDALWARYSHGIAYDEPIVAVLSFEFPGSNRYPFQNGVLNEVHTFSSSLQNEVRAGYTRVDDLSGVPFDSTGQFPAGSDPKVGYPYNNPYPGFTESNISTAEKNIGTLGVIQNYIDNIFDYGDTVTWLRGKHILKGGAQVIRYQENFYYGGNAGTEGEFVYNGIFTKDLTLSPVTGTGYGFADFVLDASENQQVNGTAGRVGQRQYRMAFFGEDEWKLTPKLTLNIGLRYGYDQPLYEVNNKEVNVDVKNPQNCPNCLLFAGQNGASRALYNAFHKQYMPRVSFAYQMNPIMVIRGGYAITDDFEGMGTAQRLTANPPFISSYYYQSGSPTATTAGNPIKVSQGFNSGALNVVQSKYNAWDPNIKPELVQQYNLTLQTLLSRTFTFQIGYVGNVAQHLVIPEPINQETVPGNTATEPFAGLVGTGGQIYETLAEGYSNYNAMQIQLRQRQWHGLEATFNYTFSKNMTNNPGYFGTGGVDGPGTYPQNIYNPHGDYGVAAFDTRNAANFVGTYAVPFGRGRDYGSHVNRYVDWAIGGWKVSGNAVMYSGFPITIGSSLTNVTNNGGGARANQYQPLIIKNRSLAHWFGTDPTATPCTLLPSVSGQNASCAYGNEVSSATYGQQYAFGTAHVGTERAPGFRDVDVSAFKQFHTYKGQLVQFRADAFNVGNISSYAAPAATVSTTSTFGQITSNLSPPRQIQLSLKYEF
jgi:hypothetical protein